MTIRNKLGEKCKAYLQHRALARISKNEALRKLLPASTISTGAQFTDYVALYDYVKTKKPKEILEFGPGVTTLFLAQACYENRFGRITAMEELQQYFEETERLIPDHLRPYVDLRLSPSQEYHFGPFRGVQHTEVPKRAYDFIYIDGPQYDRETSYDGDVIEVVKNSDRPIDAIIDSRTGSCFIYHLVFGKKFSFSYLLRLGYLTQVSKKDVKDFPQIVASTMKKRAFKRHW